MRINEEAGVPKGLYELSSTIAQDIVYFNELTEDEISEMVRYGDEIRRSVEFNGGTVTYIVRYTDASGVASVNLYQNSVKLNGFTANVSISGSGENSKVVERKITLSNIQGSNGSKYISTENHVVTLQYDTLKSDLESSDNPIKIGITQVEGLKKRLDYLESDESGVKSITGTDSKIVLVGNVQFDSNIFSLDSTSNTISVAAGKFEVAGESKETERKIIGNESDTFDDLTLYGLRSGIKEIKQKTLNLDSVGPGLTVKEFIVNEEPVNKITLDIKENSSLMIDSEGKLDLG